MERHPDAEGVSLTVLLPPDRLAADPSLEAATREAIARNVGGWTAARELEREVGLPQARTVAGSAILFFAAANLLSLQYAREGFLLGLFGDVMDVLLDGLGVGV